MAPGTIHGENDEIIPVTHSRRLIRCLHATGRSPKDLVYPGGDHSPLGGPASNILHVEIVDFLLAGVESAHTPKLPAGKRGGQGLGPERK